MTITIDVPSQVATALAAEAARQGKDVPEVVSGLVEQRFGGRPVRPYDPAAALALLDLFDDGDEDE